MGSTYINLYVSSTVSQVMKFLAIILFIAHVAACSSYVSEDKNTESLSVSIAKRERVSDVTLKWLNQTTMQITWPEKEIDLIHLKATKNLDGSPSKCIFKGTFGNGTGDEAAVVGCMGDEAVVNIAHDGGVSELTLRDGVTLEFVAEGDGDN